MVFNNELEDSAKNMQNLAARAVGVPYKVAFI